MDVEPDDTIQTVKGKIYETSGLSIDQQKLIYQGKSLDNNGTLASYNIQNKNTLHLITRVRGKNETIKDNWSEYQRMLSGIKWQGSIPNSFQQCQYQNQRPSRLE